MRDLWERLEEYARAYLPWWQYRRDGEEPEMALLTALGSMLEGTAEELERLPDKHEEEFLRALAPDPRPGTPPLAWAALSAPRRAYVPAGTEFYLAGDAARAWRTVEPAWAERCRPVCQMFVEGERGKLVAAPPPEPEAPTRLFDFRGPGVGRREARFSHPRAFASRLGCTAALGFSGSPSKWLELLSQGDLAAWFLEDGGEARPLEPPKRAGDKLVFALPPAPEGQALLVQVAGTAPWRSEPLGAVTAETFRPDLLPDRVLTADGPQEPTAFTPFGEEPEPWQTCHIGCADALSLGGGEVELSWTASLGVRERRLPAQEEPPLRAVMRRLPPPPPQPAEVYADAVAWEYWDGGGWRPIPGSEGLSGLFGPRETSPAQARAALFWPEDAQPCALEGRTECWLRWRVRRAEGSGLFPRLSRFPEVTGLILSARLRDAPVGVERRWGVEADFSPAPADRPLFPAPEKPGNSWWLGFDPPPEGPLCLWLELDGYRPGGALSAWEALPGGATRPLTLRDDTQGLAHSGAVALGDIRGERTARFGKELWWLCLKDEAGTISGKGPPPDLTALSSGAVALGDIRGERTARFGRELWWLCLQDEAGTIGAKGPPPVLTALSCGAVLLRGAGEAVCAPGESLRPLRGGAVSGRTLSGSVGGSCRETDGEALDRARSLRVHLGRGMSAGDIDHLLRDRLSDVVRARCVPGKEAVEVGVLLREGPECPAAFALRRRELLSVLERETVLPALGLAIVVREPCFYAVHTSVWLTPPEGTSAAEARRLILEALEGFLHPVTRDWALGTLPKAKDLEALVRAALPGVKLSGLLAVAVGPDGRERAAEEVRDPFALPVSGTHTLWIGEEEST